MREDLTRFCSVQHAGSQAVRRRSLTARIDASLATGVVSQVTERRIVGRNLAARLRGRDLERALLLLLERLLLLLGRPQLIRRRGSVGSARGPDILRGRARAELHNS